VKAPHVEFLPLSVTALCAALARRCFWPSAREMSMLICEAGHGPASVNGTLRRGTTMTTPRLPPQSVIQWYLIPAGGAQMAVEDQGTGRAE